MAEQPWGASWIISAPWAHPLWHTYAMSLADLTTDTGKPPILALPGATHEMLLCALDPNYPTPPEGRWISPDICPHRARCLTPANYAYQFKAESNEQALYRINRIAALIRDQKLSPDTDFRSIWDTEHFADAVILVDNAIALLDEREKSTLQ